MNIIDRKYPVGIQTFERIIKEGYLYIDKTDLVWRMTHSTPFVFLSRPRRFGKSLLTTTLEAYFNGDKSLFEGLKIMALEKEWRQYPVLHFDLSTAKNQTNAKELFDRLLYIINPYVKIYGKGDKETTPGTMFEGLIRRAYEQTGKKVVILLDEYDAPLLDVLHENTLLPEFRRVMQEFYQPLKASERMIQFCFITGITKFSQLSIFSTINNLTNISLLPQYATICGITEEEFTTQMACDIQMMAEKEGCTLEEMHAKLKGQYDGYRFAEDSPEVYNPYSLLKCFLTQKMGNYWFESGTPTFLIRQMQHFRTDITSLNDIEAPVDAFDLPTEGLTNALPLLYQSGYLTIKDYDKMSQIYSLAIPNNEVTVGLTKGLIPMYTGLDAPSIQTGFAVKFWRALLKDDINLAMEEIQAFLSGIPYVEGFKEKLQDIPTKEGFYEYTLYLIFSMLNVYVQTQVKCHGGRIDMVVMMPTMTYIFEFKTNLPAKRASRQISERGYAKPYQTEGRRVTKVGVRFNVDTWTVEEWQIEQ